MPSLYEGLVDPLTPDPDRVLDPATTVMGELLRQALAGDLMVPQPTIGLLVDGDGVGLLYPGKVNGIAGDSGVGKSWIALRCALGEAERGRRTVWIDYEDTAATLAGRMAAIGWPVELGDMIAHVAATAADARDDLHRLAREDGASLVVIDSTGEALATTGANPNADNEVAAWFQREVRPISEAGPAVLLLDHLVKSEDGGLWPSGSHRKRAAITGVQFIVKTHKPFSRTTAGRVRLVCAKDRSGAFTHGQTVCEATFAPKDNGALLVQFWKHREEPPASDGGPRPTSVMTAVSAYLEANPGALKRDIEDHVTGKATTIRRAIEVLVVEGHVVIKNGSNRRKFHTVVKPFQEAGDA